MWLFFPFGFVSVVQKPSDPKGVLCVRARDRKSLEQLGRQMSALGPIEETWGTDYPFRARVDGLEFGRFVSAYLAGLDVPNFKDAATEQHGVAYHDACFDVWEAMTRIAPRKPYARKPPSGAIGGQTPSRSVRGAE